MIAQEPRVAVRSETERLRAGKIDCQKGERRLVHLGAVPVSAAAEYNPYPLARFHIRLPADRTDMSRTLPGDKTQPLAEAAPMG